MTEGAEIPFFQYHDQNNKVIATKVLADLWTVAVLILLFLHIEPYSGSSVITIFLFFFMLLGPFALPLLHGITPPGPGRKIRVWFSLAYCIFWFFRGCQPAI